MQDVFQAQGCFPEQVGGESIGQDRDQGGLSGFCRKERLHALVACFLESRRGRKVLGSQEQVRSRVGHVIPGKGCVGPCPRGPPFPGWHTELDQLGASCLCQGQYLSWCYTEVVDGARAVDCRAHWHAAQGPWGSLSQCFGIIQRGKRWKP